MAQNDGLWQSILVPTDFSSTADSALDLAIHMARHHGARLELVHVLERYYYPGFYGAPETGGPLALDYDLLAEKAEPALEKLLVGTEDLSCHSQTRVDAPGPGIVTAVEEVGADLVVMGSRGLTGLRRWILGSTAEYVVRHCPCPVLTVKPSADHQAPED